jgi:Phd_YefM.
MFPRPKKIIRGAQNFYRRLTPESADLQQQLSRRPRSLINDLLDLTTGVAYIERLLENTRIKRYLAKHHGAVLDRIEKLLAEVDSSRADPEEDMIMIWSVSRAKKDLDELIRRSRIDGPQMIKRVRWPVVVIVSIRRWRAMLRRYPELQEFFWQKERLLPPRKMMDKVTAQDLLSRDKQTKKASHRRKGT